MLDDDEILELHNYRAHRFGITKLESGKLVLFDPAGDILASGDWTQIAPSLSTGPEHYDVCTESWGRYGRPSKAGSDLLQALGLVRNAVPSTPTVRRI